LIEVLAVYFKGMSPVMQSILSGQASLQEATRQLQESGFQRTLASLCESLTSLKPVLRSFREPFVLQAVPARGSAPIEHPAPPTGLLVRGGEPVAE
jgi:hypothetical protein